MVVRLKVFIVVAVIVSVSALLLWLWFALGNIIPHRYAVEDPGVKFLEFENGSIRYQENGTGSEGILFLHGFNGSLGNWELVWPYLDNCRRSVRIDIPGFGASDWQTESFTLTDQARRVIAFLDKINLSRVTVVGTSMGASLAAWLASTYPERIKGAVLLAPSGLTGSLTYKGIMGHLYHPGPANRFATRLAKTRLFNFLYPRSRLLQGLTVTSSYGPSWDEAINKIQQPVAILWSKGDRTVPFAYSGKVDELISNSILIPLDKSVRHNIPGKEPKLVANLACTIAKMESGKDVALEVNKVMKTLN